MIAPRHLCILALAATIPSSRVAAREQVQPAIVDQIGGITRSVAAIDGYVLMGTGPRALVIDVSQPASPLVVARSDVFPDLVRAIDTDGTRAYILISESSGTRWSWAGGLYTMDIRNLRRPATLGALELVGGVADLCVSDTNVFVAAGLDGLHRVSVDATGHMTLANSLSMSGDMQRIICGEETAILADENGSVRVVNLQDSSHLTEVARVDVPGAALDVALRGEVLYVLMRSPLDHSQMIGIIRLDDSRPRVLAQVVLPFQADRLMMNGSYLYAMGGGDSLSGSGGMIASYDVTEPMSPVAQRTLSWPGLAHDVSIVGLYAYAASEIGVSGSNVYGAGLRIISLKDPTAPQAAGALATTRSVSSLKIAGSLVVSAASIGHTDIHDLVVSEVSSNGSLVPRGSVEYVGLITDVEIARGYVLALVRDPAISWDTVVLVSITDPDRPKVVGSVNVDGNAFDIAVDARRGYIATDTGIQSFALDALPNISLDIRVQTQGSAVGLAVASERLAVGTEVEDGRIGFQVFDVSDPWHVQSLGTLDVGGVLHNLVLRDDRLYAAAEPQGLYTIELSQPTGLSLLDTAPIGTGATGVVLGNSTAYVSGYDPGAPFGGLWTANIADKGNLEGWERFHLPRAPLAIAYGAGYLAMSARDSGLHLLRVEPVTAPTTSPTPTGTATATSSPSLTPTPPPTSETPSSTPTPQRQSLFLPYAAAQFP